MNNLLIQTPEPDISKLTISVIGVGYVGLPLAVALAAKNDVYAYDINPNRIDSLKNGFDATNECSRDQLLNSKRLYFTSNPDDISSSNVYIITVPTPVNKANVPNLEPLIEATTLVAGYISRGDIIVYESTVYPGATEEVCVPVLEQNSGLKLNTDFYCGYSPERINPGDSTHSLDSVVKVVSGSNAFTLNLIDKLYSSIIAAGTYRASSIKVAEASKVIENAQRDLNIAFINELSLIFSRIGVDTDEVLKAAATKWNFINLKPGLVGGHCIGVDPYYLAYKAEELGYNPQLILAGRRINDYMATHVVTTLCKVLSRNHKSISSCKIGILGVTFKDNCPDTRNSKVFEIIRLIHEWGGATLVADPLVDSAAIYDEYKVRIVDIDSISNLDALIVAVQHDQYRSLSPSELFAMTKGSNSVLFDLKAIYPKDECEKLGFHVIRL